MQKKNSKYIEAMSKALKLYANKSTELINFNTKNYDSILKGPNATKLSNIDYIINTEKIKLRSIDDKAFDGKHVHLAIEAKWHTLNSISKTNHTPEIKQLKTDLLGNNYSGITTFLNTFNSKIISAPNLALLKTSKAVEHVELPRGLNTTIKNMNVETASILARNPNLLYDAEKKTLYSRNNRRAAITIKEANVVFTSLEMLSNITEEELIDFLDHLNEYRTLGTEHSVGKKIMNIISKWSNTKDFDCDVFYHGRPLDLDECPHTKAEMLKAPTGVTTQGRYNSVGQNHYYFSDKREGAIKEVKRHSKLPYVQIAKLEPIKSIKMIDLSESSKKLNKFLDYCRYPSKDSENVKNKREYLIPCFVADCCKYNGIDGIKYFGDKDYSNYVVWDDGHFKIIESEVEKFNS